MRSAHWLRSPGSLTTFLNSLVNTTGTRTRSIPAAAICDRLSKFSGRPVVISMAFGSRPCVTAVSRTSLTSSAGAPLSGEEAVAKATRSFGGECGMAADDDRYRSVHRLWSHIRILEAKEFAVERRTVGAPQFAHDLDILIGACPALLEWGAYGVELFFKPTHTDAEQDTSCRHIIKRGDLFGGNDRIVLGKNDHAGSEFDAFVAAATYAIQINGSGRSKLPSPPGSLPESEYGYCDW